MIPEGNDDMSGDFKASWPSCWSSSAAARWSGAWGGVTGSGWLLYHPYYIGFYRFLCGIIIIPIYIYIIYLFISPRVIIFHVEKRVLPKKIQASQGRSWFTWLIRYTSSLTWSIRGFQVDWHPLKIFSYKSCGLTRLLASGSPRKTLEGTP